MSLAPEHGDKQVPEACRAPASQPVCPEFSEALSSGAGKTVEWVKSHNALLEDPLSGPST